MIRFSLLKNVQVMRILLSGVSGFRQLLLPLVVALCVGNSGCSNGYEFEYAYYEILGGGVMDDTTVVLLGAHRESWYKEEIWFGGGDTDLRTPEINLFLADIRFEKVYWKKNITNLASLRDYGPMRFDFIDSVFFFYAVKGHRVPSDEGPWDRDVYKISAVSTVNIADGNFQQSNKIELKHKEIELQGEGWSSMTDARVRPWRDGSILANSFHYFHYNERSENNYALINYAIGTMELWKPSGEFEWLNDECTDAKWDEAGWLCLKNIPNTSGFVLLRNGTDTLAVRHRGTSPYLRFNGNSIISSNWVYLINKQGQISENPLNVQAVHGFLGNDYHFFGVFRDLDGNLLVDYNKDKQKNRKFLH
jgi:hypothetical protein